jgi:pyruvate dehydrogenase E1 component alpha subunit
LTQHSALSFRERLIAFERELERRMPEFKCSVHLCLGQEDVPEVLHEMLRPEDWLFSTHRSHGHYLAKGGSEQALLDEILGLETGVNGGYSGSQSFCDPALRFHSTAVVGGLIGVATGTAFALKLEQGTGHRSLVTGHPPLVVCCLGDAATEQGVFWESLNFAALHQLPILYVCENNGLSVHAPIRHRQARPIGDRVWVFGLTCWEGVLGLRQALSPAFRHRLPGYVEVTCKRECRHVSAMEDLREQC